MKNQDVVRAFFAGRECHSTNLRVERDYYDHSLRLVNYATTLLQQDVNGNLIYNATKYSVSTSRIQHYIRLELSGSYKTVDGVDRGTYYLKED